MSRTRSAVAPAGPLRGRPARLRRGRAIGLAISVVALVAVLVLSVVFGSREVSVDDIVRAFSDPGSDDIAVAAVRERIPRTILGLLVGAALALAGTLLQGVTRNPIADPGLLGISTGAALSVVVGISVFSIASVTEYIWFAIVGALVAALLVYSVASIGRRGATPLSLALAGAATNAAFISLMSAVLISRQDVLNVFRFWQVGGIGGAHFSDMLQAAPFLIAGALLAFSGGRGLNALALGDDLAAGLGRNVALTRGTLSGAAVLLIAAATALAGPIGFVGLVIPHLTRLVVGSDHRWVLPYSAVFGSVLLLAADVLGRVVTRPADLEVGIVTALLGAPVFIAILRTRRVREL